MKVDGTVYWAIFIYTDAGVLVDADSDPTVAVRKNDGSTADAVTVTKRAATTGIYDCEHAPSGEVEGDTFGYEETATVSAQAYINRWSLEVFAAERGTDNASTFDSASDTVITDSASRTASQANVSALATSASIAALNDFDPSSQTVANVGLVAVTTTNSDMRGTDGANTVVPNTIAPDNAGITANGTAISSLNNITVQQVWDALTSGSYVSGSFGERLLVSQGTHRTVQVTGSNHVAADVHEFQSDSITAAAIAADAVTELQTGLVTVGTAFTYTNGSGDTHNVTIS
jgi:hypothetical protein